MGPGNRPLDLDWLEDFMALADSGNFSRAATMRAIAQPAFSRHIRALETWVGVDLVDRSSHPTELTAAGQKFHGLAADIIAALEAARIKARAAQAESAASLRFAVTHVLSMTFFPQWLTTLEGGEALGPVHLMSDSLQACEDLFVQRRVQFLLCHAHPAVPNKADDLGPPARVLARDVLVPVTATSAGGPAAGSLDVAAFATLPLLGYSEASALGRILRSQLLTRREVSEVFTAHHAMLLKALVLQGRGIAWLPLSLVRAELDDGGLQSAGGDAWIVPIEIRLYRQPTDLAPTAERLWRRLDETPG